MYLGELPTRPISSPLREDEDPSFSLFHSDKYNKTLYKDFATGEVGDCFTFVMRLFRYSAKTDAFNRIVDDFSLTQFESNKRIISFATTPLLRKKALKKLPSNRLYIQIKKDKWRIKDKNYWHSKYGLNKEMLEYCNIWPISHYFINGIATVTNGLAYAFMEEKDGIQTFKIYQPFNKEHKWINNNDFSTWELWTQMPDKGDNLIITSSRKDAVVIKSLFTSSNVTSCSLQSEGVNPKESVINELKGRFKNIFVLYDNDYNSKINRGRVAGEKLCKQTGFLQLEIPHGFKTKDPSDFREMYTDYITRNLILDMMRDQMKHRTNKRKLNI